MLKHLTELNSTLMETITIVEITSDGIKKFGIKIKNADPFNNESYFYLGENVNVIDIDFIKNLSAREFLNKND